MSGLVKGKEYNVEDSNVENIGSDMDRDVKKQAAKTEIAWKNAGKKLGLQIWRIEDFEVVAWPREKYGEFHRGDSYIILRTYKEPDSEELEYDLHFWLGKESTQDEMGTAAYKTVELDTLLDDKPVQYREVEGFESQLFRKCFGSITYLEGGVKSGFNHVVTNSDNSLPMMYEICGETEKDISVAQVPKPSWESLHSYSTFVITIGKYIIRFYGARSNMFEKYRGACNFVDKLKSANPRMTEADIIIDGDEDLNRKVANYLKQKKKESGTGDEDETDEDDEPEDEQAQQVMEKLVSFLGEPPEEFDVKENEENVVKKKEVPCEEGFSKKLICVERMKGTGKVKMDEVASGDDIASYNIDEKHSYILDKGKEVFGYAGKKVDKKDKNNQMVYCNNYLQDKVNKNAPLSTVKKLEKFQKKMEA